MKRSPRKVLHVMNAAGGGAAVSTLQLIRQLKGFGIRACAVCHDSGTPEEMAAVRDAVEGEVVFASLYWWNRKIRAARWKRPALELLHWVRTRGRLGSLGQVAAAAHRFGAELLHTNTVLTPEGGVVARALGLPHVWHVRELIGPGQPFQLPLREAALGRYLAAHASRVVANSEASAVALAPWLPEGLLSVVPNGVDLTAFAARRPGGNAVPVVAMLGNLTSRTKKHQLLVDAARVTPGVEFRIYGHAPRGDGYADGLRAACDAAGVQVMGFVPTEQAMADIDVLVHPADNESFGRTAIEAMAAGVPVVGARGGGIGESVVDGETGLLFTPDSAAELARCVRALCSDPALRRRLGERGRARVEAHYSLAVHANRIAAVYQEALVRPLESGLTALTLLGGLT